MNEREVEAHYLSRRSNKKVVKYRKPFHLNIEVIVFLILFVYIAIISINYFRKDHISIYEVVETSISDDNVYKGIVLRDETIYRTEKAGYINYYISDGEKVGKNATVYSVDETGEIYKQLEESNSETVISEEDTKRIRSSIATFHDTYTDSNYSKVTDFKYNMENAILELNNSSMVANLNKIAKAEENKNYFQIVAAPKSGIITYTMDNKETLQEKDITKETFANTEETRVQLRTNNAVTAGSPVYKMINSETWHIIIPLTDVQYQKLTETDKVNIALKKDDLATTAAIETYQNGGDYFARLTLNKYVVRYLNERYLDIEIMLNSANGLKIPATSVLEKDFLLVPLDYLTESGSDTGVVKETYDAEKNETDYEFVKTTIYKKDEEKSLAYIEADGLADGDYIRNPETQERYQLGQKGTLEGVYNVNKGYAVFRVINKVYENKEYVIVEEGTSYGLSVYDNIVVNADTIHELQIIGK